MGHPARRTRRTPPTRPFAGAAGVATASARFAFAEREHPDEEVSWTTRDRRRSPSSTRCASASTRADAALLTEYRGLNVAAMAELRRAAARGRRRLQDLQEHPRALRRPRPRPRARRRCSPARPPSPSSRATPVARGQGAARLRPHQPDAGGQGRPARRRRVLDADGAKALAERRPREVLLAQLAGAHGRADAAVRRPARRPCPATSPTASRPSSTRRAASPRRRRRARPPRRRGGGRRGPRRPTRHRATRPRRRGAADETPRPTKPPPRPRPRPAADETPAETAGPTPRGELNHGHQGRDPRRHRRA